MEDYASLKYWNDLYSKDNFFGTGPTKLAQYAETLIKTNKIHSILEIGCGQGRDAIYFSQFGYDVKALDISPKAIEFVNKIKEQLRLKNLTTSIHDIEQPLEFNHDYFDLVYSNLALHFFDIDKLNFIFNNIAKVLKKNSHFLFSTKKVGDKYHNFGNKINENAYEHKGIIRYFYGARDLQNLISEKFDILQFDADKHSNLDASVSVWWKILAQKK